eukprot:gene23828-1498_t
MSYIYFAIISKTDAPVFQAEFNADKTQHDGQHMLKQFIIHSTLDPVDDQMWKKANYYLPNVDRFNTFFYISAFVTAGYTKFLLMQDKEPSESVKTFFNDVHELYLKQSLSPFHDPDKPIASDAFLERVRGSVSKHF